MNFFFVLRPPPHNFSNGPSLSALARQVNTSVRVATPISNYEVREMHASIFLLDCEQSLIFPCKVTARETQAREPR